MFKPLALVLVLAAAPEKKTISWSPPATTDDDRPLIVSVVAGPQDTDYALKIELDKPPFGDGCGNHCVNATLFLDTDNSKGTGLKLKDAKAPESGVDLAITLQAGRGLEADLKVLVKQFNEEATGVDQTVELGALELKHDAARLRVEGNTVFVLIDANLGNQPVGAKMRVVYHPPDHAALVGVTAGLSAPSSAKLDVFRGTKLSKPSKSPSKAQ